MRWISGQPRSRKFWVVLLVVVAVIVTVDTASPTSKLTPPNYRTDPCDRLSYDLGVKKRASNSMELEYNMHSVGCSLDEGGVYVKDQGDCAAIAYNEAKVYVTHGLRLDRGFRVWAISEYTKSEGCIQFEDGSYMAGEAAG